MKAVVMGGTREFCKEREDVEDWVEEAEDDINDNKWHSNDDEGVETSGKFLDGGIERVCKRGARENEVGCSVDRSEPPKEPASERSRIKKKSGQRRVDVQWDDSQDGKACGRRKRSRDDGWRDRSRGKEGGDGSLQDNSDDVPKAPGRRGGEDVKGNRLQVRSGAVEERDAAFEGVIGPSITAEIQRIEDDRIAGSSVRSRIDMGGNESEDRLRLGGRGRPDEAEDYCRDKLPIGGGEKFAVMGEEEDDGGQRSDNVGGERFDGSKAISDTFGNPGRRSSGNAHEQEELKSVEGGDSSRYESEERGEVTGRRRGGKTLKEPCIWDGRKGTHGNWVDIEWDWIDADDFKKERASGKIDQDKCRGRYVGRDSEHGMENEYLGERERRREWEEDAGWPDDQMRDRYGEEEDKARDSSQDVDRPRGRDERERSGRERKDGCLSNPEILDGEKTKGLIGSNGTVLVNESPVGGFSNVPLQTSLDPRRDITSGAEELFSGGGDTHWEGSLEEESVRGADCNQIDNRERHSSEDEPPPGLQQILEPSPYNGGVDDPNMVYNLNEGRGRPKFSASYRSRAGTVGHESRPNFMNYPGTGLMIRGFQPSGKGIRGGKGPGKVGRVGGRDGQRCNLTVISQMGPGIPGPVFGQLGPPGHIAGLGPGIIGRAFPIPPFGGRIGWNSSGDMGMMNVPVLGPPRFVAGMGPGPPGLGPNIFFTPSGHGRGGPNALSLGAMCGGNSQYGGRPVSGDRGQLWGKSLAGGYGTAARGPSRGEQNDYSQHFVDTGLRPQNFIRDVELADRFEEYPKLKELIARKDKLIAERATPPMYMQCDLRDLELRPEIFGTKFDVILVDPPWEEYVRRAPGVGDSMEWWSHLDIQSLRIEAISDTPAFIFLWVGDAEGLDQGRLCLKKWGFRRCEDICWVKTNRENPTPALRHDANTVLQHSKEHCLMGIKGTVRRSTDGHIIHANVDTDIIISEEPDYGSTAKPEELYHIIEHFAQGQRRIELFGEDHNIRAGWVTVGKGLSSSNFSPQTYAKHFFDCEGRVWQGGRGNPPFDAPHLVGTTSEIESLRPKSPAPRAQQQLQSHAANAVQLSGTNPSNKRTFAISQGVLPSVSVHPTLTLVGAGNLTVNSKLNESVIPHDVKPSKTHRGIGPAKIPSEDQSFTPEVVEVPSDIGSV